MLTMIESGRQRWLNGVVIFKNSVFSKTEMRLCSRFAQQAPPLYWLTCSLLSKLSRYQSRYAKQVWIQFDDFQPSIFLTFSWIVLLKNLPCLSMYSIHWQSIKKRLKKKFEWERGWGNLHPKIFRNSCTTRMKSKVVDYSSKKKYSNLSLAFSKR